MIIITGGQTGVDQGCAEACLATGTCFGGWAPDGFRTEAGVVPRHIAVHMDARGSYRDRTVLNVTSADALLVFYMTGDDINTGTGTRLSYVSAWRRGIPVLAVVPGPRAVGVVAAWLDYVTGIVMVAGPRESRHPGIGADTRRVMEAALHEYARRRGSV